MNYIKIATVGTIIAMTPALAAAGNLNANTAVEEVVIAPAEDDDAMVMGSLSPALILGGLAAVAIAVALSESDSSSGT